MQVIIASTNKDVAPLEDSLIPRPHVAMHEDKNFEQFYSQAADATGHGAVWLSSQPLLLAVLAKESWERERESLERALSACCLFVTQLG